MMVVFVSQCEKNALLKTRQILDAFSDRIGSNTWQTAITEKGLLEVKKLLKKTATKNTSVSCHWIRTRSRSDLMWIVGNKNKFNSQGIASVNYTQKAVIMERPLMQTKNILANVKSQPLSQHSFAVGYLAFCLIKKVHVDNDKLARAAFIAGIFHDIGKIDPQFQSWLSTKIKKSENYPLPEDGLHIDKPTKFSFENHPRHQEISWVLSEYLLADDSLNNSQLAQIAHAIYWHHSRPLRKNDKFKEFGAIFSIFKRSLKGENFNECFVTALKILSDIKDITQDFKDVSSLFPKLNSKINDAAVDEKVPEYKRYKKWSDRVEDFKSDIKFNSLNNLIRAAVISSDRKVSSLSSEDLNNYIEEGSLSSLLDDIDDDNDLITAIHECLSGFNNLENNKERNIAQSKTADDLARLQTISQNNEGLANISVLQGPAGCGKTKIALEWSFKTNVNKIIWVCPRVQVCMGLLNDLTQEDYLPNSRIEIFTGEYKKILVDGISFDEAEETSEGDYFSGDIVITTIDQVVSALFTHRNITTLVDLMLSHVVLDEFHELISMPAFNLLFAELIECKKLQGQYANTLLVSATPNYYYVTRFLGINDNDIVHAKNFNKSKYNIKFVCYDETQEKSNPLINTRFTDNTFVITNTAYDAQIGFINNITEKSVLLHSKYTKKDKAEWFGRVFDCFKRNGSKCYDVLRSGPIIQASLNISCDNMLTELTCPENWLQRLGRLDRFGRNKIPNSYITILPKSIELGKQTSSCAKFLKQLFLWEGAKAWMNFIRGKLESKDVFTLDELYLFYREFYSNKTSLVSIEKDFLSSVSKGVQIINDKILEPISVPSKSRKDSSKIKISKFSLRGDSRFVQMAKCHVDDSCNFTFLDEYVYPENYPLNSDLIGLTESVDRIRGYGDSEKDLLVFMKAKHHNIKPECKKVYKDFQLLNNARSPENPVYLSYIPQDLVGVGGVDVAHSHAIYYVTSNRQPVGSMELNKSFK